MNKKNEQNVDDLVKYIDNFVRKNGGHLSVVIDQENELQVAKFTRRPECLYGACQTKNLLEGLEDNAKEEENQNEKS